MMITVNAMDMRDAFKGIMRQPSGLVVIKRGNGG